jgi:hypothetical protein
VPAGNAEIDDMPERQAVISPQSAGLNSALLMAECQWRLTRDSHAADPVIKYLLAITGSISRLLTICIV